MERIIRNLSALLTVQVAIGAAVLLVRPATTAAPSTALLAVTPAAVDQITIDGDAKTTTLQLKDKHWIVQQLDGFPADQAEVTGLLDRIAGLQHGLPLATSAGALKRFKLADDSFERRVVLSGGGKTLGTLYIGSAIDARHANGRAGGDSSVYSIGMPVFEVPAAPGEWTDRMVLQAPKADVASIAVGALTVERAAAPAAPAASVDPAKANGAPGDEAKSQDGKGEPAKAVAPTWRAVAGTSGGEQIDSAAVERLDDALARLQVGSPLGTEPKPEFGMDAPALDLTVKKKDGTAIAYQVGKRRAAGDYVIKSSLRPEFFALPGYLGDQLVNDAKREALVKG